MLHGWQRPLRRIDRRRVSKPRHSGCFPHYPKRILNLPGSLPGGYSSLTSSSLVLASIENVSPEVFGSAYLEGMLVTPGDAESLFFPAGTLAESCMRWA